jgi:hypothetical protein
MANLLSRQQQIDASLLMRRGAGRLAAPLLEAVPRALRTGAIVRDKHGHIRQF